VVFVWCKSGTAIIAILICFFWSWCNCFIVRISNAANSIWGIHKENAPHKFSTAELKEQPYCTQLIFFHINLYADSFRINAFHIMQLSWRRIDLHAVQRRRRPNSACGQYSVNAVWSFIGGPWKDRSKYYTSTLPDITDKTFHCRFNLRLIAFDSSSYVELARRLRLATSNSWSALLDCYTGNLVLADVENWFLFLS